MKCPLSVIVLRTPTNGCLIQEPRPVFRWRIEPKKTGQVPGLIDRKRGVRFLLEVVPLEPSQEADEAFKKATCILKVSNLDQHHYQISAKDSGLRVASGYAWRVSLLTDSGELLEQSQIGLFYLMPTNFPVSVSDLLCCDGDILLGDFGNWEKAYGSPLINANAEGCLNQKGVASLSGNQNRGHAITRLTNPSTPIRKGRRYKVSLCIRTTSGDAVPAVFQIIAHNGSLPTNGMHPAPSSGVAIIGQTGAISSQQWTRIVLPGWRAGRDFERVAVLAMSGADKDVRTDLSAICVREVEGCGDQIEASFDEYGNVSLPPQWQEFLDPDAIPGTIDVEYEAGLVTDIMGSLFDAAGNNSWYGSADACVSIGGVIPPIAGELADEYASPDLGDGITPDDIEKATAKVAELLAKGFGLEGLPPIKPEVEQHCSPFESDKGLPFSGRDIIYIHGFRPDHVVGAIGRMDSNLKSLLDNFMAGANNDALEQRWPQDPAPFAPGGWYQTQGESYWSSHIERHLGSVDSPSNRYLVVGFNSNQRLIENTNAVLHQIANAMSTGEGVVYDEKDPRGARCFGRRAVIVSHSTGAIVADVMMTLAQWTGSVAPIREAFGDAVYIPRRIDAHVSLHGAISGSEIASLAVVGANALASATGAADVAVDVGIAVDASGSPAISWLQTSLGAFGISTTGILNFLDAATDDLAALGRAAATGVNRSILVDLMPIVSKGLWGAAIDATPVPVVTVAGAHPSGGGITKLILPGLDDGVVSTNSQSASPNPLHPDQYIYAQPPTRLFDMGITLERAAPYFAEQLGPVTAAYGSVAAISATGMLQPVLISTPALRYRNHFTFLQSASEHSSTTTAAATYTDTGSSNNREETLVIERIEPLLTGLINPAITSLVSRSVRGQDLIVTLVFSFPVFTFLPPGFTMITINESFAIPLWRRTYDLLPSGAQEDDHVYSFVLR